jgi:exopolyphosphatase/guanosine-5'-triphosphate,3'-diphosphate pyrophosphatase
MRVAALDLGSNSFHLIVVDARADGSFETLLREREMLRLGDQVARHGCIPPEAADAAAATVGRMHALALAMDVDEVVACATSAIREAENGSDLVDRIEHETGVQVEVISGKREARLIFGAVRASVVLDPAPALCLDLGGGSLEVMVGDSSGLLWSTSRKLGVGRLTAELVRHDPPGPGDVRRLRKRLLAALRPLADEVADLHPQMLVVTSGTLVTLARLATAHRTGEVPAAVNQLRVRAKDLTAVHRTIVESTSAERARLPGLDGRRADQLPAGSTLLLAALELFGVHEVTVSGWALREGMILEAIRRHDPVDWSADPRAMRRASVLDLARRCNWDEAHARQVAHLATDLFDQTLPVHRLGVADRELLEYGALLHDIGEHVAADGHDRHGAYLIEHGRLRGFDPDEVHVLAVLARFHRRGMPKPAFPPFGALAGAAQTRALALLALLRVADALDRSHAGAVEALDAEVDDDRVVLVLDAAVDVDVELWGLRRKRELFERVLGRRLEIRPAPSVTGLPRGA